MLVFEMALFLLMLVPLPLSWRSRILKGLSKSAFVDRIKYVMRILFGFVVVLFVDSVMKAYKTPDTDHKHSHDHIETLGKANIFHAQRNMYLTGSVIFLSLVLDRLDLLT